MELLEEVDSTPHHPTQPWSGVEGPMSLDPAKLQSLGVSKTRPQTFRLPLGGDVPTLLLAIVLLLAVAILMLPQAREVRSAVVFRTL